MGLFNKSTSDWYWQSQQEYMKLELTYADFVYNELNTYIGNDTVTDNQETDSLLVVSHNETTQLGLLMFSKQTRENFQTQAPTKNSQSYWQLLRAAKQRYDTALAAVNNSNPIMRYFQHSILQRNINQSRRHYLDCVKVCIDKQQQANDTMIAKAYSAPKLKVQTVGDNTVLKKFADIYKYADGINAPPQRIANGLINKVNKIVNSQAELTNAKRKYQQQNKWWKKLWPWSDYYSAKSNYKESINNFIKSLKFDANDESKITIQLRQTITDRLLRIPHGTTTLAELKQELNKKNTKHKTNQQIAQQSNPKENSNIIKVVPNNSAKLRVKNNSSLNPEDWFDVYGKYFFYFSKDLSYIETLKRQEFKDKENTILIYPFKSKDSSKKIKVACAFNINGNWQVKILKEIDNCMYKAYKDFYRGIKETISDKFKEEFMYDVIHEAHYKLLKQKRKKLAKQKKFEYKQQRKQEKQNHKKHNQCETKIIETSSDLSQANSTDRINLFDKTA